MKQQTYSEYKESGVKWLGQVPGHWNAVSLKWISQRYSGGTPDKSNDAYWENGDIPWLNSGSVNDGYITEPSTYITREGLASSSAKWIPANALVMALAGQGKTKGMVAQLGIRATCNQSMAAIIPKEKFTPRFLYWWLVSNYQNIRNMAGGEQRDGLNLDMLGSIPCPLLPLPEQTAIADFLDRETGRIDTLMEKKRQLIALLKEKRTALISHIVTRGLPEAAAGEFSLEPHIRFKDSGMEWLGQVPEEWDVLPFTKYVGEKSDYRGKTPEKTDDGIFLVTAKNVRMGFIDYETSKEYVAKEDYDEIMRRGLPKLGDILFTTEAPLGNVALVDYENVAMAQRIIRFRMRPKRFESKFTLYGMMSDHFQNQLKSLSTGSTAEGLKASKLTILRLICPPLPEQAAIATYLDRETAKIDKLVEKIDAAIVRLQEYRTALISSATTGKIDVREVEV